MAGLSTIADMVPLTGENRVIAAYGLKVMRKSPRLGFQKLCKVARVNQAKLTEDDVGFMIAPRVNAASRMGDPRDAFRLFTTEDEAEADMLAKKLEATNRSRRAAGAAITRAIHDRLRDRKLAGKIPPVIAMGDPDWRPGLLGLAANSIAEEYGRPTFLWGKEGNDTIKGSCRSGPGRVNIVTLMQAAGDAFLEFGGHAASGGYSVASDAVFDLEERLAAALATLPAQSDAEAMRADMHITPEAAIGSLLQRLERFAPFGMKNEKPSFALHDVRIDRVSWFGKAEEHLRLHIGRGHEEFPETPIEAIAFFAKRELGSACEGLEAGTRRNILAHLERDLFSRGQPIRLRLIAIR
jgi:single-stranded-DNA-specific exonuclease